MSELLFKCPFCERTGFTERGLHLHRCRQLPRERRLGGDIVRAQIMMQTAEAKKQGTLFKEDEPV